MYGINNNTGNIYNKFDALSTNNNRFENSAKNNEKQSENKMMKDAATYAKIAIQLAAL